MATGARPTLAGRVRGVVPWLARLLGHWRQGLLALGPSRSLLETMRPYPDPVLLLLASLFPSITKKLTWAHAALSEAETYLPTPGSKAKSFSPDLAVRFKSRFVGGAHAPGA